MSVAVVTLCWVGMPTAVEVFSHGTMGVLPRQWSRLVTAPFPTCDRSGWAKLNQIVSAARPAGQKSLPEPFRIIDNVYITSDFIGQESSNNEILE